LATNLATFLNSSIVLETRLTRRANAHVASEACLCGRFTDKRSSDWGDGVHDRTRPENDFGFWLVILQRCCLDRESLIFHRATSFVSDRNDCNRFRGPSLTGRDVQEPQQGHLI
jgi:hypothetical protein